MAPRPSNAHGEGRLACVVGSDRMSECTEHHSLLLIGLHGCKLVRVLMLTPVHYQSINNENFGMRSGPMSNTQRWPDLMKLLFFYNLVDVTLTRTMCLSIVAGLFQQDNAPCHKAKVVQEQFEEHSNKFEVFTLPPKPPDINPSEHLQDMPDTQGHLAT